MEVMDQTTAHAIWPQVQLCWSLDKESKLKLSLEISAQGALIIASCKGRLVYRDEAGAFVRKASELLPQAEMLVLDLSQVETIDGAGLGHLLELLSRAQKSGCSLKLVAPEGRVRELLELTNLVSVFEVNSTLDQALASASLSASTTAAVPAT
jgi:anti-sigma B factor antagonist